MQTKVICLAVFVVAVFLSASSVAEVQKKVQPLKSVLDSTYFPIGVGYEWIYASDDGDITFKVTGKEKVGNVECFVVKRSLGKHTVKFYISTSADGVRIHRVGDDVYKPPFLQFKFSTKSGDKWKSVGKVGKAKFLYDCVNHGESGVTVPLGYFKSISVANYAKEGNAFYELVKGIGVVHIFQKKSDKHDPIKGPFNWKLKKFTTPADRRNFAKKMNQVKAGMTKAEVETILGKPDDIRNDDNELVENVWCYGSEGISDFPTLGQVNFDQSEKVFWSSGGRLSSLPKMLIGEKELRKLIRLINTAGSFASSKNFIDDGYDPLHIIKIVNTLQPLGKEKALFAITEFLRAAPFDNSAREGVELVLRVLFKIPDSPGHMPYLAVGGTTPAYPANRKLIPRFPILIKEDVPFYFVDTYIGGGERLPAEVSVEHFRKSGKLRKKKLTPPDNPLSLLEKLEKSPQWIFADNKNLRDTGRLLIMHQLLLLVDSVYPTKPLRYSGRRIFAKKDLDKKWNKIKRDIEKLNIRWDTEKNDYVKRKKAE